MPHPVHAITAATSDPAFWPGVPAPPTEAELVERTCLALSFNDRAGKNARKFTDMVRNPPEGMVVARVFLAPADDARHARREYEKRVISKLFTLTAREYGDALSRAGMTRHGIKTMLAGKRPVTSAGYPERFSFDHNISICDGGLYTLADSAAPDPDLPMPHSPHRPINHRRNLTYINDWMHRFKNTFEMMQAINNPLAGKPRWALTIVAARDDKNPGFICLAPPDKKRVFAL